MRPGITGGQEHVKKAVRCYIKTVCISMGLFSLGLLEKTENDSHSVDQFNWKYVRSVS